MENDSTSCPATPLVVTTDNRIEPMTNELGQNRMPECAKRCHESQRIYLSARNLSCGYLSS